MLITPRPGTNRDVILQALQAAHVQAGNLRGGAVSAGAYSNLLNYLQWATDSAKQLRYSISDHDLTTLIFTPRYYALLGGASGGFAGTNQQALVNGLVGLELEERVATFEAEITSLKALAYRWNGPVSYVVGDSSFYIHGPNLLHETDFTPHLGLAESRLVRVLFPMKVVDELDGLKRAKAGHQRGRASVTLASLERVLNNDGHGMLRAVDPAKTSSTGDMLGEISVEILFDPPGHVRMDIADDEIVDRAVAAQGLSGRSDFFYFLTCDSNQYFRARRAGLKAVKVPQREDV